MLKNSDHFSRENETEGFFYKKRLNFNNLSLLGFYQDFINPKPNEHFQGA